VWEGEVGSGFGRADPRSPRVKIKTGRAKRWTGMETLAVSGPRRPAVITRFASFAIKSAHSASAAFCQYQYPGNRTKDPSAFPLSLSTSSSFPSLPRSAIYDRVRWKRAMPDLAAVVEYGLELGTTNVTHPFFCFVHTRLITFSGPDDNALYE
jgi:hypothetical protein